MDAEQIQGIAKGDPFLKKFSTYVIFEHELPDEIKVNCVYVMLLKKGLNTMDQGNQRVSYGHWVLLETIQTGKNKECPHFISYFDPMGVKPSLNTYQKMLGTALQNDLQVYVNTTQRQLSFSQICGILVIYVALLRARKYTHLDINKNKFSKSLLINAITITDIINSLMPRHMSKIERFSLNFV